MPELVFHQTRPLFEVDGIGLVQLEGLALSGLPLGPRSTKRIFRFLAVFLWPLAFSRWAMHGLWGRGEKGVRNGGRSLSHRQ